jgi:hypothetical protein
VPTRSSARRRAVAVLVACLSAAASTAVAGVPAAPAAAPCRYPGTTPPDRWAAVATPPGAASAAQLDQDPCTLLAAGPSGRRWRSTDAGVRWTAVPGPAIARVLAERLQPRAGAEPVGPLLGIGAVPDATGQPQVYVSDDDGVTFAESQLGVAAATPAGPVGQGLVPLRADLVAAATAVHYTAGRPEAYVYASAAGAPGLLKSTDGGHTFGALPAARHLTVSAIALNPTSQDEIWVNDTGRAGGAWVSYDGGTTFTSACCPLTQVRDISVSAAPDGGIVVLLATDTGLLRSTDDGKTWLVASTNAVTGIRTPADDASTLLAATATGVVVSSGPTVAFRPVPGLPASCAPHRLRRDERVPATFLVDCGERPYRLLLRTYGAGDGTGPGGGGGPGGPPGPGPGPDPASAQGRPLTELAHWALPGSDVNTGTIAFDGATLYYDMTTAGDIGRVRASDGAFLGTWHTNLRIWSLTVDLRRNQLLVTGGSGGLFALDLVTRVVTKIGTSPGGLAAPSYDSSADGLSYLDLNGGTLYRRPRTGEGPGTPACSVGPETLPSTFVASGDGGGYVQSEDDSTLFRVSRTCATLGRYTHRTFSESGAENDAMACDTQSYFPQPAIWLRDSLLQSVSAYGVPFGYCPMPSRLSVVLPRDVLAGSVAALCAGLGNATNGVAAADRGVEIAVGGVVAGHGQTDATGRVCVPYAPAGGFAGRRDLPVTARFAGDSALYPSSAAGRLGVLDAPPVPPVPRPATGLVPPPPLPPAPAVPPNPVPNPGQAAAPAQAPAPNAANAPAGQAQANAQPVAQGVVAPQRQQQPQLALARAANRIGLENNQMVAPAQNRRRLPVDAPATAALLGICCAATVAAVRPAFARSPGPRRRTASPAPPRWR